jgi:GntR family transcriptional regulator of arabinose operon
MAPVADFKRINKTQQVCDYIENLINEKELRPGDCILAESKLAQQINVSLITVRRAMSQLVDKGLVYRVHGKGTFVAGKSPDGRLPELSCIATLFPYSFDGRDLKKTLLGIQHALKIGNYNNFVHFGTACTGAEEAETIQDMRSKGVKGFIIYPAADEKSEENIAQLDKDNIPYVLLDKYFDSVKSNYVGIDEADGALKMVEYLSKRHKKIGFITANLKYSSNRARLFAYQDAVLKFGLPFNSSWIWNGEQQGLEGEDTGYKGMMDFLKSDDPPTAVVAVNCNVACGAQKAVWECGKDLSEKIQIASFDFENIFREKFPSIHHLIWPRYEIGKQAVILLDKQLKNKSLKGTHLKLKTQVKTQDQDM